MDTNICFIANAFFNVYPVVAQFFSLCLTGPRPWVGFLTLHKTAVVEYAPNPRTGEIEAGEPEV